jgi:hypothetical protein
VRDLTDRRLIYLKGGLFVVIGLTSTTLLLLDSPELRTALLLALCIWAFARAYYFAFYVLERYVDPAMRYSGLFTLLRGVFTTPSHHRAKRAGRLGAEMEDVMDTKAVGDQLVGLCKEGKNREAIDTLYDENIVSIEAQGPPDMPLEMKGIDAVRGKNEWWFANHEIHSASAEGPFVNGDQFAAIFDYDVTAKSGPQEGQRFRMKEVAVYTVVDGKVVKEQFHY